MKGTKLFLQLQSLSKDELKLLHKAVNSPYFNSNPSVTLLFDKLRTQYPNFDESIKGRRLLYQKMFPNQAFNDGKLRRLFTFLSRTVDKFIVCEMLEKDEQKAQQLLVEYYDERHVVSLFEQSIKQLIEQQDEQSMRGTDWYQHRMNLLVTQYASLHHPKYDSNDKTLSQAVEHLDYFYVLQKLKLSIGLENRKQIFQDTVNLSKLPLPAAHFFADDILVQLYFQSYALVTQSKEVDFAKYEQNLQEMMPFLSEGDKILLFYNGLNYLIRLDNRSDYSQEGVAFRWYQWGITKKILFINGQLSVATFNNIVSNGCNANALDWVTEFIQNYAKYLPKKSRKEEVQYSSMVLLFHQKKFKEISLGHSNYEFSKRYLLKTKHLLSRTYFELFLQDRNYLDVLMNYLQTFESYLHRNDEFSNESCTSHLHFAQILKTLAKKESENIDSADIEIWLRNQLQKRPLIIGEKWLRKRLLKKEMV